MVIEAFRKPDLNESNVLSAELQCRKTAELPTDFPSGVKKNYFPFSQLVYNLLNLKKISHLAWTKRAHALSL
jgi:hypothetical protein